MRDIVSEVLIQHLGRQPQLQTLRMQLDINLNEKLYQQSDRFHQKKSNRNQNVEEEKLLD